MDRIDKIQYRFSLLLKFSIAVLAVLNFMADEYLFFGASLFVLFLTFLPAIITRKIKINLPPEIDLLITALLFLHYVLGEYGNFYIKIAWWDIFLHGLNSLIFGLVGVIVAYALLMTSKIEAKPLFISLIAFSFAVCVGVIWEIFEFTVDQTLGFNMQKSGLMDTMTDLITDVLGAIVAGGGGYIYLKQSQPEMIRKIIARFVAFSRKSIE